MSDASEIKRLVGCTVSGARTPSWGRERGGMDVPFGYDRNENRKRGETTKYSSQLFSRSGDKDRRGADPVLHPLGDHWERHGPRSEADKKVKRAGNNASIFAAKLKKRCAIE